LHLCFHRHSALSATAMFLFCLVVVANAGRNAMEAAAPKER
jgi:hypothetical protein